MYYLLFIHVFIYFFICIYYLFPHVFISKFFYFFTLQAKFLLFNKAILLIWMHKKKKTWNNKKKSEQLSLPIITVARCQQSDIQQYSEKILKYSICVVCWTVTSCYNLFSSSSNCWMLYKLASALPCVSWLLVNWGILREHSNMAGGLADMQSGWVW